MKMSGKLALSLLRIAYGFSISSRASKRNDRRIDSGRRKTVGSIGKIKTFLIKIKFTEYLIKALQYNCPRTIGGNKKKT
jgi:hypothetical protein